MVRLEKINVQGFKSFKRQMSLPFPTNFAVVTGPNGSGKSNCSDAIFFVMGKGSSKGIRAKKAKDLIFHGSDEKKGSDYAKVSLVFSNDCRSLPLKEEKVSVTRRLNKEGVSTYRLNGKVTPRQQILDIFTQGRLFPGGHNIIKQGDVTRVVEMNPAERRTIIDEISGITEYDEKKVKSLKELEKVEEKVKEAEIILEQKEEIILKLKDERDTALRYRHMLRELDLIRATLVWKEYSSARNHMKVSDEGIRDKEKEIGNLGKRLEELDGKMAEKEKEEEDLMKEVYRVSDRMKLSEKLSRLRSEIESKDNLIGMNEREIVRLDEMIKNLSMIEKKVPPKLKEVLSFGGVHGLVSELVEIPAKYRVATDVAAGGHMNDIVVDNVDVAARCIKYLKENRIGRARFLPMDRIDAPRKPPLPQGTYGWLSELVHHEPKYTGIMEFIFGRTACLNDIDKAKEIAKKNRIRMVTLDGDLIEPSGAMTGGFYLRSRVPPETKQYLKEKEKLQRQNEVLEDEIAGLTKELNQMRKEVPKFEKDDFEKKTRKIKKETEELREKRREVYESRMNLQQELNDIKISKARYEANFDTLKIQWDEQRKVLEGSGEAEEYRKRGSSFLKDREREILEFVNQLGPVNMKAIEEFDSLKEEFEEFRGRVDRIVSEKESIIKSIAEIESKKREIFNRTMEEMAKLFREIYSDLTSGGDAELSLEDPYDLNSGLMISASPPGKKLLYIDSMSGGEKTLTALAFLFTIQRYRPAPFYVLDEVDAALDKPNTRKVVELIRKHSKGLQFIVISHNNEMIRAADLVYGVSMDRGESKVMGIKLPNKNN